MLNKVENNQTSFGATFTCKDTAKAFKKRFSNNEILQIQNIVRNKTYHITGNLFLETHSKDHQLLGSTMDEFIFYSDLRADTLRAEFSTKLKDLSVHDVANKLVDIINLFKRRSNIIDQIQMQQAKLRNLSTYAYNESLEALSKIGFKAETDASNHVNIVRPDENIRGIFINPD